MSMLAIALALTAASGPALSQDAMLRGYLACAAKRHDAEMHLLLDTKDEGDYRAAADTVTDDAKCDTKDEATATVVYAAFGPERGKLRGMVAEVLLKRSKTASRLAPQAPLSTYTAGWFAMTGRPQPIDEMAMCVAAINPGGITRLLATKPASSAQRDAFAALTPSLGTCLAKGYQLDTKPAGLRAALAEALYHRDYYAGAPGGGASK